MSGLVPVSLLAVMLAFYWGPLRPTRAAVLAIGGVGLLGYLSYVMMAPLPATLLLLALLLNSACSLWLARRQLIKRSRRELALTIVLAFGCYAIIENTLIAADAAPGPSLVVPFSLGFFALRQIHLVYECYRRGVREMNVLDWAAYVFFVPTIVAGPLERIGSFQRRLHQPPIRPDLGAAAHLLISGLFKKIVVADFLLIALLPSQETSSDAFSGVAWSGVVFACGVRLLHLYFDFAGYTDLARGVGHLFGFSLMKNFDHPLLRPTLARFWQCWHISLSSFMRDYLYMPLLVQTRRPAIAVTATMVAIGLWHGLDAGWILWALHHALGLIVLARVQHRWLSRPALRAWRTSAWWYALSMLATWTWVAAGSAFIWHPQDPLNGLAVYARFWGVGGA